MVQKIFTDDLGSRSSFTRVTIVTANAFLKLSWRKKVKTFQLFCWFPVVRHQEDICCVGGTQLWTTFEQFFFKVFCAVMQCVINLVTRYAVCGSFSLNLWCCQQTLWCVTRFEQFINIACNVQENLWAVYLYIYCQPLQTLRCAVSWMVCCPASTQSSFEQVCQLWL